MAELESLTPTEVKQWLGIRVCLEDAARAVARYTKGPDAHRPGPSRQTLASRAVREQITTSEAKSEALMRTREHICFERVENTPGVAAPLRAYVLERGQSVVPRPTIYYPFLRGCLLAACGTAPGFDGAP